LLQIGDICDWEFLSQAVTSFNPSISHSKHCHIRLLSLLLLLLVLLVTILPS
jgi:hypothetical protein